MLAKLGWVLLWENGNKSKVSLNHIRSDENLERLVERLWNIESYGTLHKGDPKLLPKSDSCAINIIVWIGVLPPLKNTPRHLNLETVQASPLFRQLPLYIGFS